MLHQKGADPCYRAYVPILAAPSSGHAAREWVEWVGVAMDI